MQRNGMRRVVAILMIGLAAGFASGCGDSEEGARTTAEKAAERAADDAAKAVEDVGAAAREGAAAQLGRDVEDAAKQVAGDVEAHGAAATAESAAETLEGNVERSADVYEKTYDAERAKGEGAVDAAGDAYSAVEDEADKGDEKPPAP